MTKQTTV